jgi:hypothetical protein
MPAAHFVAPGRLSLDPLFEVRTYRSHLEIVMAYWPLAILMAILAVVPWIQIQWMWRFGLRTLRIAITFAGIMLGLINLALRK